MTEVTVLGMGEMGRALALALVNAGRSVTVWNRTPGKGVAGAAVAGTAEEAVAASPIVVVCVVNYAAVDEVLASADGKVVVNLTNGTPAQARATAARLGPSYVDGGIMAVPAMIGGPGAFVLYSGSAAAFAAAEPVLKVWGTATFLGADPGRAALYDLALLSAMYGMFGGVFHALALTAGEEPDIRPMLKSWLDAMTAVLPSGRESPESNLEMQAVAYVNLLDASRDRGVRTDLVAPMGELLHRAVATGSADLVALLRSRPDGGAE